MSLKHRFVHVPFISSPLLSRSSSLFFGIGYKRPFTIRAFRPLQPHLMSSSLADSLSLKPSFTSGLVLLPLTKAHLPPYSMYSIEWVSASIKPSLISPRPHSLDTPNILKLTVVFLYLSPSLDRKLLRGRDVSYLTHTDSDIKYALNKIHAELIYLSFLNLTKIF